jgi:Asp-tRNA(Asn)/Glu-tRNA(Gln) amidotransferase A subunit family amidase
MQRFRELVKDQQLEFLIAPVHAHPAVPHGCFRDMSFTASYTLLYNYLNYSSGVLPVTKVDSRIDQLDVRDKQPADYLDRMSMKHYDAERAHGMPVGVQIIGGYYEDEKTLEAMKLVEKVMRQ